jgi:hypothetical protein
MKPVPKQPRFVLSDTWAIETDPLNWRLLKSARGKDGEHTGWKIVGYYSNVQALLKDLHGQILLTEPGNDDLIEHINHAFLTATTNLTAFSALVDAMGQVPDKTRQNCALGHGGAA